ncbi:MAG TPA: acyloxyacyl hydrolase, partial [Phnomibacter sp.]|nr:acyloxyacyl hydrolase [Phnomibacter sp.]
MRGLAFFGLMLTAGWLLPVAGLMGQAAGGFGATVHYGSIFAHSEAVQNTRGAQPLGIELQYWRQRRDNAVYNTCRCYPRSGPLLFYTHFDSRILGSATGAGWLLEPNYRLAPNLHLQMRAAAGLLVANRPYDALTNATNQSYSTRLNAWLMYGLGVNWELTERLTLQVSGNFQHLSNGGVRQPNKGVNWPTASVGMLVQRESAAYFRGLRQPWQRGAQRPLTWEVGAFGVAKRVVSPSGIGTRYPVVGVWGLASRQVAHTNALAAGLE